MVFRLDTISCEQGDEPADEDPDECEVRITERRALKTEVPEQRQQHGRQEADEETVGERT